MPGGTSGLAGDISLFRRRGWLFIPAAVVGLIASLSFGNVAGESNAVASMALDTVIQDIVLGGDRGLRVFEAQSMTTDPAFIEKVKAKVGDPAFDYARFSIALAPISVADGVSKGIITVSVTDPDKLTAERYRAGFVEVFTEEYTAPAGLWRTRFLSKKQEVVDEAETRYQKAYDDYLAATKAKGLPGDEVLRSVFALGSLTERYNIEQVTLEVEAAAIDAALRDPATAASSVQAARILGVPVPEGQAETALKQRRAVITATLQDLAKRRDPLSDGAVGPSIRAMVDDLRSLADIRRESYVRLNNATVAVISAQSTIATSYTFSGGVSGTTRGKVAVAFAVTLVLGVVAVYGVEWFSQVRRRLPAGA
ncbi:MAG: hypothetical protein ACKVVT_18985 [Dehalococcoidia bacterium]